MIFWRKIGIDVNATKIIREQKLHEGAWQLLREVLEKQYGMVVEQTSFEKDIFGKPYLIEHPEIHFNISHCNEIVACMIGTTDVGIDIEEMKPFSNGVIKKVCSMEEQEFIWQSDEPEKYFFKLWTLKESYIKAVGRGLQLSMKSAVFSIGSRGEIESNQPNYTFRQEMIEEKYILSICERR